MKKDNSKETKEKEKNENTKDKVIKIILIIIIIILLLHNCVLIKKSIVKEEKTPTGNVDVFEIMCDKDTCDKEENYTLSNVDSELTLDDSSFSTSTSTSISSSTSSTKSPQSSKNETATENTSSNNQNDENQDEENGEVVVKDKATWTSTNTLRIFTNPVYNMEEKISPESSNIYQFVVKNNTNTKVKYSINFKENNIENINMKYKLRKGSTYIVGNDNEYVSYEELNQSNISLNKGESDTYYLEWKWVSSDNDTIVGSKLNTKYKLSIEIKAESNE